jgi:uncharacterized Rmd1/YagE family protein
MAKLFSTRQTISARALFVGQRLDIRAFEKAPRLAAAPWTVEAGADGCAVLFRYGVVVLFGLPSVEEVTFLEDLKPYIVDAHEEPECEEIDILLQPDSAETVTGTQVVIKNFSIERVQLIADVLAKSVVLAHYEARIAKDFDRIEPFAQQLRSEGTGGQQGRDFVRHIGDTLIILSQMVGRVAVGDKPEVLWEFPDLERLYLLLEDEFEIRERHAALERKLDLISRTAETLLDLLHNQRSLRVEWYIVILIVVDIIVSMLEKFPW